MLSGYIAKQYYLHLDEEIEPCIVSNTAVCLTDLLKTEYKKQLTDIAKKSEELGKKEHELKVKEQQINVKSIEVTKKENENRTKENALRKYEYQFYCNVLSSGHCKSEYVRAMGEDFWEEYLQKAIEAGRNIGKTDSEIKQEISYAMVSIYKDLGKWDKAYDFLVEQCLGCSWLHLFTVQTIVEKVGACERLKSASLTRLGRSDLSKENIVESEKIWHWLVFEYGK